MSLEKDYTIDEVADALGMSKRWLSAQIKQHGWEHMRAGHKIRFTTAQVQKLRDSLTTNEVPKSLTTGRKTKRSA